MSEKPRQIRLDPDVADWVEDCAVDYELSLSATANKLLRALRDEPVPEGVSEQVVVPSPAPQLPDELVRGRVAPGRPERFSPRAAQVLRWHRDGEV